jgi:5-(aminomethyl)-3-furanmethanol phosphate kinase
MTRTSITVAKVGGSLLSGRGFEQRLRDWIAAEKSARPETHLVLVVGGGKWVDAVRELDANSPIDEVRAHWLCIEILDITTGLVHAMLPELRVVADFDQLGERVREPGATLLKPHDFLSRVEPTKTGTRLPANWSVTSDSIAGRLAVVLGANRLILLKSQLATLSGIDPPSLGSLADAGYLDGFFPELSGELPPFEFRCLSPNAAVS